MGEGAGVSASEADDLSGLLPPDHPTSLTLPLPLRAWCTESVFPRKVNNW